MPKNWKPDHDPFTRPLGCNGKYGTSGSKKHRRNNQAPCDPCKASEAHYACELRRGQGLPRHINPCGTNAAYKRHLEHGEPIDFTCRVGRSNYLTTKRNQAKEPKCVNTVKPSNAHAVSLNS